MSGSDTSNDLLKRLDLLADIPHGVTAIADEAIFRDAASIIRELERRLEAANARIQRWQMSGEEASPHLAVAPLELADGLLAQIGFQPDCSIRHNLAIALGHVRGHETNRDPRTGMTPAEAEASRLKAALLAYGSHTDDCGLYGKRQGEPHECTCGLFEAQGLLPDGKPKHQSEKG